MPQAMERSARSLLIAGQEHPGQGDVLELAQVAEVVLGGQALLTRPVEGFTQPPCATHTRVFNAAIGRTLGKSHSHTGALPRRAGRARRPDRPGPPVFAPSRRASDTGFAGTRCARPAPCFSAGAAWRHRRSLRSRWSSLIPTYMSAVPRSTGVALCCSSQAAIPARRYASPRGDDLAQSGYQPGRLRH